MQKATPYLQLFRVAPRAQGQSAEKNGRRIAERNNQLYFKPNNSANKRRLSQCPHNRAFFRTGGSGHDAKFLSVLAKLMSYKHIREW
ncbi:hypothetical protein N7449_005737 [Penicillium cf. viridicatum]|uniref:Uncharacterized protein n=1 Tax=Penicillium cf. viridicatum TaxID=2972119 RepID=A0A9W9MGM7_9EURO|nr:hypothetical protein N7449_005737 [Penicillium cf. viridicatum]